MGAAYRGEDIKLGRLVALEFLPDNVAQDPQVLARFQHEARAASALKHPSICTIYEIERPTLTGVHFHDMDGITLKHCIAGKTLTIETVLSFGIEITEALDAAHAAGIVHLDIKPGYVFITC